MRKKTKTSVKKNETEKKMKKKNSDTLAKII